MQVFVTTYVPVGFELKQTCLCGGGHYSFTRSMLPGCQRSSLEQIAMFLCVTFHTSREVLANLKWVELFFVCRAEARGLVRTNRVRVVSHCSLGGRTIRELLQASAKNLQHLLPLLLSLCFCARSCRVYGSMSWCMCTFWGDNEARHVVEGGHLRAGFRANRQ